MKKIIALINTLILGLGTLVIVLAYQPEPAEAAVPGVHEVIQNLSIFNSANQGYIRAYARGVLSWNSGWTRVTNADKRPYLYVYQGDTITQQWQVGFTGTGKVPVKMFTYSVDCPYLNNKSVSATATRNSSAGQITLSITLNTSSCPHNSSVVIFTQEALDGKTLSGEARGYVGYVIYNHPSAASSVNTWTDSTVDAGTYVNKSVLNSGVYSYPFSGINYSQFESAPNIGLYCSGSACSGSALVAGTHTFRYRSYVSGADAGYKLVNNGNGMIAQNSSSQAGGQAYTLRDNTFQHILNVIPGDAQIEHSELTYSVEWATSVPEAGINLETGSVKVIPLWKDRFDNITDSATGEIEYLGYEGSATPVYNNQKITFTTPGISTLSFRLSLNGVYKDFESEAYPVQSLAFSPTILSLSPQRNDYRNPDDNLLIISGYGFIAPLRFYVGGRVIDTTNITLATSGEYLLNIEMPELPAGFYDLVITTPQGVTTTRYEYYDNWVDVKVPPGTSATSSSKMIVIKDLAGITADRQIDIAWLAKSEITLGCKTLSETSSVVTINYCPGNPVNRGAMAELLAKTNSYTLAKPASVASMPDEAFTDIASLSAQRQIAIAWLAKTQITLGCADGSKYCPASPVTRGAMAEFLFKLSGETTYRNYTPGFKDISGLSAERIRAINWMKDRQITLGSGSPTTYKPNDPVNRGAMAQFLHRFVEQFSS